MRLRLEVCQPSSSFATRKPLTTTPTAPAPSPIAGRDQAARLGVTLAREVGAFDVAVSSDAQRARETFAAILACAGADESWHDRSIYDGGEEEIIELARTFTGEAGLIVGHEPVISYAGYILARQEDRGVTDRGVPTATALVLSFEGAWENLAPGTCAMRVFYTPPTR